MKTIYLLFLVFFFNIVLLINDAYSQWVYRSNGIFNETVYDIEKKGSYLFAGTGAKGIYRSVNNGEDWYAVNNGLSCMSIQDIHTVDSIIFAGTTSTGGIFRSTNNGESWFIVNNGLWFPNKYITSIINLGSYIFIGTLYNGVYCSTNNGDYWYNVNGEITNMYIHTLGIKDTKLFVSPGNGIFLSTNYGVNWRYLTSYAVGSIVSSDNSIFAESYMSGMYKSTDDGENWLRLNNLPTTLTRCLALYENNIFVGTDCGIFLSTNDGTNWIEINQGLPYPPNYRVLSLLIKDNYIYAGLDYMGVWCRSIDEILGINNKQILPFCLQQNYPNPFNKCTFIKYQLISDCSVVIKLFDIYGNLVNTIVDCKQTAGEYKVRVDASKLKPGMYFYQMTINNFRISKQMIVIE